MADFLINKFVQYSFVRCQNFTPVACQSLNFRMPWGRHMNQGAITFIGPDQHLCAEIQRWRELLNYMHCKRPQRCQCHWTQQKWVNIEPEVLALNQNLWIWSYLSSLTLKYLWASNQLHGVKHVMTLGITCFNTRGMEYLRYHQNIDVLDRDRCWKTNKQTRTTHFGYFQKGIRGSHIQRK